MTEDTSIIAKSHTTPNTQPGLTAGVRQLFNALGSSVAGAPLAAAAGWRHLTSARHVRAARPVQLHRRV